MSTKFSRFLDTWRPWLFRAFAILALAAIPLTHISAIHEVAQEYHLFEGMLVVLLIVTIETLLDVTSHLPSPTLQTRVLQWSEAKAELTRALKGAKTLDIICSSSESFFLDIARVEGIATQSLRVRLLMRCPQHAAKARWAKIHDYTRKWNALGQADPTGPKVEIRYHETDSLRGFLVDDNFGLVGFFEWSEQRQQFVGDCVPLILADVESPLGSCLLHVYRNRFDRLWATSKSEMPQAEPSPAPSADGRSTSTNQPRRNRKRHMR